MAGMTLSAQGAPNKVYNTAELGEVTGMSDNGRYVAITDMDNHIAFMWDAFNPTLFADISEDLSDSSMPSGQRVVGTSVYDFTDNGMGVGSIQYADGKSVPAIFRDGEWSLLPIPADVRNTNDAIAVTPDGSHIAGTCVRYNATLGWGQYFPVQWVRGADGEYELREFDIDLHGHMGFYPRCQSADGSIIAGTLYVGVQSTIPAMVVNGELRIFDEITTAQEPLLYFRGKWLIGYDENGNQLWTDDPDDPRILMITINLIDGFYDEAEGLNGALTTCDEFGNFYGMRTRVSDVDPDDNTSATLTSGAAIYNVNTGEWTYDNRFSMYTCGYDADLIFGSDNQMIINGEVKDVCEYYDFQSASHSFGINCIGDKGLVLAGLRGEIFEGNGEWMYFPYVVMCDGALAGVKTVYGGPDHPSVVTGRGHILVRNAESATLYDLDGRTVGTGTQFDVHPGVYVVKAGDTTVKVSVR